MEITRTNIIEQRTTSQSEVECNGLVIKTNETLNANHSVLERMEGQVFKAGKQIASFTRGDSNKTEMLDINDTDGLVEVAEALKVVYPAIVANCKGEAIPAAEIVEEVV